MNKDLMAPKYNKRYILQQKYLLEKEKEQQVTNIQLGLKSTASSLNPLNVITKKIGAGDNDKVRKTIAIQTLTLVVGFITKKILFKKPSGFKAKLFSLALQVGSMALVSTNKNK